MSDAILELKDLKKSYNQNKSNQIDVLLGANLLLKKGEVVALTAPSGAGKSTLLHIAGLLDQADTGGCAGGGTKSGGRIGSPPHDHSPPRYWIYLSIPPFAA